MKLFFIGVVLSFVFPAFAADKYSDVVSRLVKLQRKYSQYSRIFSIGKNDDGNEIWAIRISTTPTFQNHQKIGHIMVSTHHGNEPDTPEFTLAFIEDLLKRYSGDELFEDGVYEVEYTIIPVLNIPGYNAGERREHGIDTNRIYPGPCSKPTESLASINNLIRFLKTRVFAGSVTVHGYLTSLTYPWGMHADSYKSKDHARYDYIIKKSAEYNKYPAGNGAEVLYPANGCYEDYVYWKYGTWSMLLEIESGNESDIKKTIPAVRTFFTLIDRTPSTKNQFEHNCKETVPDLRIE